MSSQDVVEDEPLVVPDPGINLDVQLTATIVTLNGRQIRER